MIVGVIVLVGSIGFAAPLLMDLGIGLEELKAGGDPSMLGLDQLSMQNLTQQLESLIVYAWIWIAATVIVAAFALYYGVQLIRKKK